MIDVQRLATFRLVARAGSFAGAAHQLRCTPSAVSQQISALERTAGCPLLLRSTRGVTLTEAGRLLLGTADAVHSEVLAVSRQLEGLAEQGPAALTVATFASAGRSLLAPALASLPLSGDHGMQVTVIEAEPDQGVGLVRDGRADLALVYDFHAQTPPPAWRRRGDAGGSYHRLLEDDMLLALPRGHRLSGAHDVDLAELADDRWIHAWGPTGQVLERAAAECGFRPEVACRASDYTLMTGLVAAGVGIALVPRLALPSSTGRSDVGSFALATPVPVMTRSVGAYVIRERWRRPAAERLLRAVRGVRPAVD